MTEIDERIATERERTERLQRDLGCECPDDCPIDHDN